MLGRPGTFNLTGENMQAVLDLIDKLEILLEKIRITVEPRININVKPHVLKEAIAVCKKAIPKRPTHPILANFLLSAKHGRITLTATNLDTFIEVELDGEISEDGAICVAAFLLEKIVDVVKTTDSKPLADMTIQQVGDREILLTHKRYKATLKEAVVCEEYHFPVTPEVITTEKLYIPDLSSKFKRLQSFTKDDVLNPKFSGITLSKGSLIASNGCDIAAIANGYEADIEAVIPASIPLDILVNPSFCIDDENIKFVDAERKVTVTTKLIKQSIDLEKISIPETQVCYFQQAEMLQHLPMFIRAGDKKKNQVYPVWIELKDRKVTLRSADSTDTSYTLETGVAYTDILLYVEIHQITKALRQARNYIALYADSDSSLIAINQDIILVGFMPLPVFKDGVVVAKGCGYQEPSTLPCRYSETEGLTVEYNMIDCGYARAEYIGYEPARKLAQIKKQEEEKAAWKECLDNEPEELISAARNHELTAKLLKDHYKNLKDFKSSKFGAKQKSWTEAVRSYTFDVQRWYQ